MVCTSQYSSSTELKFSFSVFADAFIFWLVDEYLNISVISKEIVIQDD